MRFENAFDVAGRPQEVIELFADLPLVASFLPGASVGEPGEDGRYPGTLTVSFGPKRIAFKGNLTHQVDAEKMAGTVAGHASADLRGAKMSVRMDYQLAPAESGTRVTLVSEAELTGLLAEFARTGGVVVTEALLAEFAQRMSAHLQAAKVPSTTAGDAASPAPSVCAPPAAPQALSAFALLLQVLRRAWRSLWPRA